MEKSSIKKLQTTEITSQSKDNQLTLQSSFTIDVNGHETSANNNNKEKNN